MKNESEPEGDFPEKPLTSLEKRASIGRTGSSPSFVRRDFKVQLRKAKANTESGEWNSQQTAVRLFFISKYKD